MLTAPYAFRDAPDLNDAEYSAVLLGDARRRFEEHGGTLAAVVVEAVGGATLGCTTPPDGYLQGLRAFCDEFGVLMIVNEVMTGIGRTGTMLAVDHWDVRPDIVALGKGLAAGYSPMAATLVNERVLGAIRDGSGRIHGGHTYAGNPFLIATGMAVLDVVENEKVIEKAAALAPVFQAHMEGVASVHPSIVDVRGIGMMRAFEFELTDGRQRSTGALAGRWAPRSPGTRVRSSTRPQGATTTQSRWPRRWWPPRPNSTSSSTSSTVRSRCSRPSSGSPYRLWKAPPHDRRTGGRHRHRLPAGRDAQLRARVPRSDEGAPGRSMRADGDRVLLWHDVCTTSMLRTNGGGGFGFILGNSRAELSAAVITAEQSDTVTAENPARLLT